MRLLRRVRVALWLGAGLIGAALLGYAAVAQSSGVADLALVATEFPTSATSDQALMYVFHVTNAGPDSATNVRLTDFPAAGTSIIQMSPSQGACNSQSLVCSLGTIAPGGSANVTLHVQFGDIAGLAVHSAHVSAAERDPEMSDNTPTVLTMVDTADLNLTGASLAAAAVAGDTVTLTLTATSSGPSNAGTVILTTELPPQVQLLSSDASQGDCMLTGTQSICRFGTLAGGDSATVTLSLEVVSGVSGTLALSSYLTASTGDPDESNNAVDVIIPINTSDLALVVTELPSPAPDRLAYRYRVINRGPAPATGVALLVTLPPGLTSSGACSGRTSPAICPIGSLGAGGAVEVTLDLSIAPGTSELAALSALVISDQRDLDPADNAPVVMAAVNTADLAVTTSSTAESLRPGKSATYRITLTNTGPVPAQGVTVRAFWSNNLVIDSLTIDQGSCSTLAGLTTCAVGTLANGASVVLTAGVTAVGPNGSAAASSIRAAATQSDPDYSNNAPVIVTLIDERLIYLPIVAR